MANQRTRVSLDLSSKAKVQLEKLVESTNADSQSEVLRRALALYEQVCDAYGDGKRLIMRAPDGTEAEWIILR